MPDSSRISPELMTLLDALQLASVLRITASLEGDWSPRQVDIWRRGEGRLGFAEVTHRHATLRPGLELEFESGWIGVRCFFVENGENVFDEALAGEIIDRVEAG